MTQVITFFDVLRKTSRHSGALADRAQKSAALEPRVNEGEGGERQSLAGRQGESCIMHAALSTMPFSEVVRIRHPEPHRLVPAQPEVSSGSEESGQSFQDSRLTPTQLSATSSN